MASLPTSRQLARSVGIFGGAQAFTVLAAVVRGKAAAVLIGTAGVGLNALYYTFTTFICNVASLGLSSSAVKTLSESYEQYEVTSDRCPLSLSIAHLRLLGLVTAVFGALLMVLTAPLLHRQTSGADSLMLVMCLAVEVFFTILSGVELAVLKACRHTRTLAVSSIISALCLIVFVVPFYVSMHIDGVLWSAVVGWSIGAIVFVIAGWRAESLSDSLASLRSWSSGYGWWQAFQAMLRNSRAMVVLGVAFIVGGIISSGAELYVQSYFEAAAGMAMLGLYRAGYQLSITYTGMIFTAVNNDFYPRLSAVNQDMAMRNVLVTRQVRVLLLIVTPLILLFIALVPWVLHLLMSEAFDPIIPLIRWGALSVIFKCVALPIGYLTLAQGKSLHFIVLEFLSWTLQSLLVIVGYHYAGYAGIGIGLTLAQFIEVFYYYGFCRIKYGFRFRLQ